MPFTLADLGTKVPEHDNSEANWSDASSVADSLLSDVDDEKALVQSVGGTVMAYSTKAKASQIHLVNETKSDLRLTYAVSPCSARLANASAQVPPAWKTR